MVCKKYSLDGLSYLKCKGKYKIQGLQKQSANFSKLKKIFLGYSLIICILLENDYGAGRLDYRRVSGAGKCYGQSRRNILKMGHEMVHFLSTFKGHTQKWKRGGRDFENVTTTERRPEGPSLRRDEKSTLLDAFSDHFFSLLLLFQWVGECCICRIDLLK